MPGATNRFVTVTGDVYRTGEIPNDETAMTTLLDTLMKRNKQVQQTHFQHHSYLDDEAVIAHANEASNSDKFKNSLPVTGKISMAASRMQIWRYCPFWHSGVAAMRSRWIASSVHRA